MTQSDLGFPPAIRPGLDWDRYPGPCGADYALTLDGAPTGIWVRHCNHPTALRPYFVQLPGGAILDRKHARAVEAKASAVAAFEESRQ